MKKEKWISELQSEIDFWRKWLEPRKNTNLALEVDLLECLNVKVILECVKGIKNPSILDVGCGVTSFLANIPELKGSTITGIDALAGEYSELCEEFNVERPVVPMVGEAENLASLFAVNTFDFIHVSNSLDHCYDPQEVIRNLIKIVKIGGKIFFRHFKNVGACAGYTGLHQFDIDVIDGAVCIDKEPLKFNVEVIGDSKDGFIQFVITK